MFDHIHNLYTQVLTRNTEKDAQIRELLEENRQLKLIKR